MTPTPDLAGFRAAQDRLRDFMGEPVTFLNRPDVTFPPGTRMDPQTGLPYDPAIQSTASAQGSAVARAGVAFRPMTGGDTGSTPGPIGWVDETHVMLNLASAAASAASAAVDFILRGGRYRVVGRKFDGVGDPVHRLLIYGRKT